MKELHEQRVWVSLVAKAHCTLWSSWLKTCKTDSTVPFLQLLWPVTTVRMKNFLNVAPSVVIHLRLMWKNPQEFMNRIVILNFILAYTFGFRFWPTSVFVFCFFTVFFLFFSLSSSSLPFLRPLCHLVSFSILSVFVFSAVSGVRRGRGRKNWNSRDSIWLVNVRIITFSCLSFPLEC